MAGIDDRLSIFKNIATQQGYDPGEIEMVTSLAKMAEEQKKQEKETNLESVYSSVEAGLPFDVATQGLKPDERAFVYNELKGRGYSFGAEEVGKEEPFSLGADPTAQRQMAQEKRLYTREELEKQGKASAEAEKFKRVGGDPLKLSPEAFSFLESEGFDFEGVETPEMKEAKKPIQGLVSVMDELKAAAKEVTATEYGLSKLGLSSSLQRFNQKKLLAGQYLAKMVEKNRLSDADREFYQNKIMNLSPLGIQKIKEESIDDLTNTIVTLAGFSPSDFGKEQAGEKGGKFPEKPPPSLTGVPPTTGQKLGRGIDVALDKLDDISTFFFPETTEYVKQAAQGELAFTPTPGEVLFGPAASLTRKDQVGRAARELSGAAIIDLATAGAITAARPLLGKIVGPVGKTLREIATSSPAIQSYLQAFVVPTKLAGRLKLKDTAKEMIEYGVGGTLEQMDTVAQKVTGSNGLITRLTRDALGRIKEEVSIGDPTGAAKNILKQSLDLDDKKINLALRRISGRIDYGKQIGKMNPLDAFDFATRLEKTGHRQLNASTYLTKNLAAEDLGRGFLSAADEIKLSLERVLKDQDILGQIKSQEVLNELSRISPRLADKVRGVKTLAELRSVAAPFVNLGRMIELTDQASQSAFQTGARQAGTRIAGIAGGFAVGNLPGAALGFLTAPFAETAFQASRAPIATGVPKALKAISGAALPEVPPAVGALFQAGARAIPQAIRGKLQRGGGFPENPNDLPTQQWMWR